MRESLCCYTGWEIRHAPSRSLLQSVVPTSNGSLVLAADRTHRRDILHGFKYYTGGWNIKNQSYWSVSFQISLSPLCDFALPASVRCSHGTVMDLPLRYMGGWQIFQLRCIRNFNKRYR